jgi:hypothetical protein
MSKFPPMVSASMWRTVIAHLKSVAAKRGGHAASPLITNAEVITLVMGWLVNATKAGFPLWYQFAAAAYGWDPKRDTLDTSKKHAQAWAPDYLRDALWAELQRSADELDARERFGPRAVYLDGDYADPVFQGEVRAALTADGAAAAFKIPLPACKDPKSGKPRLPRCLEIDPVTLLCRKWEKCDPATIDDPITVIGNKLGGALVVGALLWFAFKMDRNQSRRVRRRNLE